MHNAPYGIYYTELLRGALRGDVLLHPTPFETEMIRDAEQFVGRWHDVHALVQCVDRRTVGVVCAAPQSGRSSLLFHIVAAAPVLFEYDELPAYYIDVATFPDLTSVQTTIAAAFASDATPWQQALLRAPTAPLLALDNTDATQHTDTIGAWLGELATACAAGQVRVIAAAGEGMVLPTGCARIGLSAVGQSFLTEYLSVMLPDGPHPNRAEQQFIVTVARGHLGTLITTLVLWYQARLDNDGDWQARAIGLHPVAVAAESAGAAVEDAPLTPEHPVQGVTAPRPVRAVTRSGDDAGIAQIPGWIVLVAGMVALVLIAVAAWGH